MPRAYGSRWYTSRGLAGAHDMPPTAAQLEVLRSVAMRLRAGHAAPSSRELCGRFGISLNAVHCRMAGLVKKALLVRSGNRSRATQLTAAGWVAAGAYVQPGFRFLPVEDGKV